MLEKPDIIILDEICSNIDNQTAEQIYTYLNESRAERITMIISHNDLPAGLANVMINEIKE